MINGIKRAYRYSKKYWGVFLLVVYIGINLFRSYCWIQINKFEFESDKITENIKLVVIADLHDYCFGKNNDILINAIKNENPDLILLVGDMIDRESDSLDNLIFLVDALLELAPVYYGLGNHELEWINQQNDFCREIEKRGVIILEENWIEQDINGQKIRIGGLYSYAPGADISNLTEEALNINNYLCEFVESNDLKIMLSHRPDSFIFGDASTRWDIDLVVSGHLHGGQVVLPFFGGIYGGDQGYFPEYVHGLYQKDNLNLLITSGLSTSKKSVPRWNNPPEIMALELLPEGSN